MRYIKSKFWKWFWGLDRDIYQKLRHYKIGFFAVVICFLCLLASFIYYAQTINVYSRNLSLANIDEITYPNLNVFIEEDFTEGERLRVDTLLEGLDEQFSKFSDEIIFTKDLNKVRRICGKINAVGCNLGQGRSIYIYYDEAFEDAWLREAICHELLHSLIFPGDESHEVVYKLGYHQVCYLN